MNKNAIQQYNTIQYALQRTDSEDRTKKKNQQLHEMKNKWTLFFSLSPSGFSTTHAFSCNSNEHIIQNARYFHNIQ